MIVSSTVRICSALESHNHALAELINRFAPILKLLPQMLDIISRSVTSAGLIAADPAIIMLRGLEEGDGVLQESAHPLACRWLIG